jgi:hypothetical protein
MFQRTGSSGEVGGSGVVGLGPDGVGCVGGVVFPYSTCKRGG